MPKFKTQARPMSDRREDEDRIVELLDLILAKQPIYVLSHAELKIRETDRTALEAELMTLVDRHFREALKPFLISKFGAVAGQRGAARYTTMINDFFIKLLSRRPDQFWKARSAVELRRWTSVVVSNQIRDFLRRENRYQDVADDLAALVEERQDFFLAKTGMTFTDRVIDGIDHFCKSESESRRLQGWVLRHRYVDGMTREKIANQLNMSVHVVRVTHDAGVVALRDALAN